MKHTCNACKKILDESLFYVTKKRYRVKICKSCSVKAVKRTKKKYKERYKEKQRISNIKNKDKIKANMLRWYHDEKNNERVKRRMRKYAKKMYKLKKTQK